MNSIRVEPSGFNQTPIFAIEEDFPEIAYYRWINGNWSVSVWLASVYVVLVYIGKRYMNEKPAFDLRFTLAFWSLSLACFSILGTMRTLPELLYVLETHGLEYSVCNPSYFIGPSKFWTCAFMMSKVVELCDTLFVVLRKQKLVLLHWYHHATVLVYAWYSFAEWQAPGRWFMVVNLAVHSLMYSYYALKAMRVRIPRQVAMGITLLQLSQVRRR